ncbi:DNA recombination protein RmuC [Aquimarina brevivitae]|uniref:DNA recombination protein RmuC n=1 Tax=Aquimarina brevivitae TaxID=323412 RepID=A0A4Q7P103_9FLAO|nr:DNA recombination protein RmuC [Aquimarina brevivitae]RZS93493.1 DNA recombination protein RmuC [Aquimarina brevivitae]
MTEYTLILTSIGIIVLGTVVGIFIGKYIAALKNKNVVGSLADKLHQAQSQVEDSKKVGETQLDFLKTQFEANLASKETQLAKANEEIYQIRKEKEFLQNELTRRNSEFENLQVRNQEQKEEVTKLQEKFSKEFENLANKILDEKSNKFTEQNKENIKNILSPLQEKIQTFEKKVDQTHKESIDYHAALRQQILGLKDLNLQMSKEANNLTRALKGDSKMQGNWGELVLERVLEKSGLEKDREYFVQQSFTTADGQRIMPDVVIHLPDNKKMVIDSKVSLTAYERFVNAEGDEQNIELKKHVDSLKKHIEQLSAKNYQDIYEIESPDFVLLFVPIEPAFAVAINYDNNLYNWAFEKNIVIVTPSTLLATLRTIDSMWNNEKQQQNAIEIATQAGRLYDQFVNLTDDLVKLGNQLKTVQGSYDGTMKKLTGKGNLIKKVENIKKLGIKQKKHINEKLLNRATED